MADEIDFDQINSLHPNLRPYVKVLLTHEFGLLRELPEIHNLQSGGIVRKNRVLYADRFQLKISYCKKPIVWQVLMNGDDVTKAPDFIMEDNFLIDATAETIKTEVPSLANWCPSNVKCLLNVVLELLELYKSYQINILRVNPGLYRYLFEYETLLSLPGFQKNDVEVFVQYRNPVIIFLIHLNVDFSMLPTALPNSKDLVLLIVEFKENAKNTIQLVPRIELEDILGGPLELPDLHSNLSLMDYVPCVENILQQKVEGVIEQYNHRKMLYSYLIQYFEPCLINGDNINFRNVSFLLKLSNSYLVLNVDIPIDYPQIGPKLHSLSLNKTTSDRSSEFNKFRYDRNWSHKTVAKNIFNFVRKLEMKNLKNIP